MDVGPCDGSFVRYYHDSQTGQCESFSYGGCDGNPNNFASRGECIATCKPVPDAPCTFDATSAALPGARLHVEADTCVVPSGQPLEIRYRLELDTAIEYTAPSSGGGCGHCGGYGSDPLALVSYRVGNAERHYCLCDVGCCAPTEAEPHSLSPGSYEGSIEWPGNEWNGPSDTSEPLGPAFSPGAYGIEIKLEVPVVGNLIADLPLRVTP
jgi:hypothetical protein